MPAPLPASRIAAAIERRYGTAFAVPAGLPATSTPSPRRRRFLRRRLSPQGLTLKRLLRR